MAELFTGTLIEVDRLPQMEIMRVQSELNRTNHHVVCLEQQIKNLSEKIEQMEDIKISEFKKNDVYEVNKRIERLHREIALLESVLPDRYRFPHIAPLLLINLVGIAIVFLVWVIG
jgi:septal ring factor EnvC (AmiA/AmiB activator)